MSDRGEVVVVVDVSASADPDLSTIDALARLQLAARRRAARIQLQHASPALRELLYLAGLQEVLPPCSDLPIKHER